ncbi:MAG: GNAT family N-acetyltransferase [Lachnospiraceae bacterium]|nr:GNAT family N-acetyltransferase [Lachnospiraceae bacterium]
MKKQYHVEPDIDVYVCDTQQEIDDCIANNVPVIGYDPQNVGLSCDEILLDYEGIDDAYLTRVHHRFYGIPMEILETSRLRVRELALSDMADLYELYAGEGITEFVEPLFPYEEELEYQKNYIKYIYGFYEYGMWLVFEKSTGKLIGRVGVESKGELPEDTVEMGYVIATWAQGQGYATEVCRAIMDYTHENLEKQHIICRVNPKNTASVALMKHLGFQKQQSTGQNDEDVWTYAY